jgi:branched-chain amino acid transport system substrate-binding protein
VYLTNQTNQNKKENEMKNRRVTFMLVVLSLLLILGFSVQALAGETYKMGLSLAITGPTSDAGDPYSKGVAGR